MSSLRPPTGLRVIVLSAGALVAAPHASAAPAVDAEILETASLGTTVADPKASGGRAVLLRDRSSLIAKVDAPTNRVTVRVRANRCLGTARMAVAVDGRTAGKRTLRKAGWSTIGLKVRRRAAASDSTVSVRMIGGIERGKCQRRLVVDWISANGKAPVISSSPSPLTSRQPLLPTPPGGIVTPDDPSEPSVPPPSQPPYLSEPPYATEPPYPSEPPTPSPSKPGTKRLYADPVSNVAAQADAWRSTRPADAALLDRIAAQPRATWLGGYSNEFTRLARVVSGARAAQARAVVTVYGIPGRDGGQYSAGGFSGAAAYRAWIDRIASTLGSAPAIAIVEPDGVAMRLSGALQTERYALLSYAVKKLAALPDTLVYLDAGNSGWHAADVMIPRLKAAGVAAADGIAVNTSNYRWTSTEVAYGRAITGALGKSMVIDTGRNGRGPLVGGVGDQVWCNPPGRGIGAKPTMTTGLSGVDAFLWLKTPGSSDGACFGNPSAGTFMPEVALAMLRNAAS